MAFKTIEKVWYSPKYNCLGISTKFEGGHVQFEIESKSGPVEPRWFKELDNFVNGDWVFIGYF